MKVQFCRRLNVGERIERGDFMEGRDWCGDTIMVTASPQGSVVMSSDLKSYYRPLPEDKHEDTVGIDKQCQNELDSQIQNALFDIKQQPHKIERYLRDLQAGSVSSAIRDVKKRLREFMEGM